MNTYDPLPGNFTKRKINDVKTNNKIKKMIKRLHTGPLWERHLPKDTLYVFLIASFAWLIVFYVLISQMVHAYQLPQTQYKALTEPVTTSQTTPEQQIRAIAKREAFPYVEYAIDLTWCESTHDPNASNTKGNYPPGSIDRGIWQINDYWHPEVSDQCAYDIECSSVWSMNHIVNGHQEEWTCDRLI